MRAALIFLIGTMFFVCRSVSAKQETVPGTQDRNLPIVVDPADRTCTKWIKDRRLGDEAANEDAAWIYGFFSGYNEFTPPPSEPYLSYDGIHLLEQIDHYCANFPKDHIASAAIRFIKAQRRYPLQ